MEKEGQLEGRVVFFTNSLKKELLEFANIEYADLKFYEKESRKNFMVNKDNRQRAVGDSSPRAQKVQYRVVVFSRSALELKMILSG